MTLAAYWHFRRWSERLLGAASSIDRDCHHRRRARL